VTAAVRAVLRSDGVTVLAPRTTPRAVLRYDGIHPGLNTVVPDGAYQGTAGWLTTDLYLKGLRLALKAQPERLRTKPDKKTGLYKDVMRLELFMKLVELVAAQAEPGTGRDIRSYTKALAEAAGCKASTVQRFFRIAHRVVQCLRLIVRGRRVTIFERLDIWERDHECSQHGVPPVRAFHVPRWLRPYMEMAAAQTLPVDNHPSAGSHPNNSAAHSRKGHVSEISQVEKGLPSDPTSPKGGSLRSPSGADSVRTASTTRAGPSPGLELARKFVKAHPLLGSTSPKRLQNVLKRFAEARPVWDPQDLLDGLQTVDERSGRSTWPTADRIHTPWAFVISRLKELHEHDDHPRLATVDPAELRCGRSECDHGWVLNPDHKVQDFLGLPRSRSGQRRCDQCRPGAWTEQEPTAQDLLDGAPLDDEEPPF
jgi:hypothetical protein